MPDIVLTTLNAKYIHTAFGLRYLLANLGELIPHTVLLEFEVQQRPLDIVESILAHNPRLVGLSVFIWNARESLEVVRLLKSLDPSLLIVLGGPEVSYEISQQPICELADAVVAGDGDQVFPPLCRKLLNGQHPPDKIIHAPPGNLAEIKTPYAFYTEEDLAHRIVYVEASRGCPFRCEFCLSSLDIPVRPFPLPTLFAELQRLIDRGLRHFKFVDRTFNLDLDLSHSLLRFFLDQQRPDLFLHFEMVPDRFPTQLRQLVSEFPPGSLQFEVGIQTFNPEVAQRIQRRQDYPRLADNLRFLRQETQVHLHADLIVGLPGESLESFGAGFDRLLALNPHEIQVGILKRLRGTPIIRHDAEWEMIYSPHPPYELLQNRLIPFPQMQQLRRFARAWDLLGNSGNYTVTAPWIWRHQPSPFRAFLTWTEWLVSQTGRLYAIALPRLTTLLHGYLTRVLKYPTSEITASLQQDYARMGRKDLPGDLQDRGPKEPVKDSSRRKHQGRRRQQRHQATP